MNYLGVGVHIGKSGLLTIKAKNPPRIGSSVALKGFGVVGTVIDVFGPISNPYVSVKLIRKPGAEVAGLEFFTEEPRRRNARRSSKGYGKKSNRYSRN
ncbi:MAG: Gar1/Naf1 family protein [Candidatus Methanosuratincola sp.]